jgi:glycosyltransferase involved in cell wall biosynthesis
MNTREDQTHCETIGITVILCTYNRCELLEKALESLASSILASSVNWEILVVDNNSADRTRYVVEEFQHRLPGRFRYLFEPKQGKSHALNAGIRGARGGVLAFADDDAVVEPEWLSNLTSELHSGEWAGAGGRIIPVWPGPIPSWLSTSDPHTMGPFVQFDLGPQAGPLTRPPYGANMAFQRDVFKKYGNFRTDLGPCPGSEIRGEDIEFANRLLAAGERLRYEPEALVRHPVPVCRMKEGFVLKWWFWFGVAEIKEAGPPVGNRQICGVPLGMFRKVARWTLQWLVSIQAPARFASKRNMWYLAGQMTACYEHDRDSAAASAIGQIPGANS